MFPLAPRSHRTPRPHSYDNAVPFYPRRPHRRTYGSPYTQPPANSVEEATREHVKATQEYEDAKKSYEKVKKTYEETKAKVREAENKLRDAKCYGALC